MVLVRIAAFTLILLIVTSASAEVPQLINYQGLLTYSEAEIVRDGNYSVTFRIYNDPVSTAELLWEEGQLVTVQDGLFAVILGAIEDFPTDLFDDPNCWLALQVGLDPEMTPRSRLTSVAFAVHAADADRAVMATTSLDKTIDAGELTQGTLDPERFSAYNDLGAEDCIGSGEGQVAWGTHSHVVQEMSTIQDATPNHFVVQAADGGVDIKTLVVPASTIGTYFRVSWAATNTRISGEGDMTYRVYINDVLACSDIDQEGLFVGMLGAHRMEATDWSYWTSNFERIYYTMSLDVSQPVTVTLQAWAFYTGIHDVTAGTLVGEFLPAE